MNSPGGYAALSRLLCCCRCFKALRAHSAQLLARAWLPNDAVATCSQHFAARASSAQVLQCSNGACLPLGVGEAVPSDGFCSVLRNTAMSTGN